MTHQLKENDAIKCESLDEWVQIISSAAKQHIFIAQLGTFEKYPILIYQKRLNESFGHLFSHDSTSGFYKNSLKEFKSKIEGTYRKPLNDEQKEIVKEILDFLIEAHHRGYECKILHDEIEQKYLGGDNASA